jgi:hypothetical protein
VLGRDVRWRGRVCLAGALALVALGCGSSQANEPKNAEALAAPSARPSENAPLTADSDPALLSGTPRRRAGFAESPITPLGEKLVEFVVTMLDGRPVANDLPLGTPRSQTGPVELTGLDLDQARSIDWFAVGFDFDFSVTMQGGYHRSVESAYMLSEVGLHLISVTVDIHEFNQAVPGWAHGLETVATDLLEAARKGTLAKLLPGDEVRRLVADEELWERATRSFPTENHFAYVEALARDATSEPTGFRMDDVELAGHLPNGRICTCKLDFDEVDGRVILEPHVHVRVVRRNEGRP